MTSKTYKRDANTTIVEEYIPNVSDARSIEWIRVRENGVLKKQVHYIYDSYGNIKEEQQYFEDWVNFISTKFSYNDNVASRNGNFNGLYLTRKYVEGVTVL